MIPEFSVSDFVALTNQSLEYVFPSVVVVGEVSSFKINQKKFVFFDLKDSMGSIGCFMGVASLKMPIENGMRIAVTATTKLTQWGKFSLTVRSYRLIGEGSIKKGLLLQKDKLQKLGLFDEMRKRPMPMQPKKIVVVSSTAAAGYADFIKIAGERWGGVEILVAQVQVQGDSAPTQIIKALQYANESVEQLDLIVLLRGGGSERDLSAFNDEDLVRAVAASRTPLISAIGHETDESFVDLAADASASTPSHAAQLVFPDRNVVRQQLRQSMVSLANKLIASSQGQKKQLHENMSKMLEITESNVCYTRNILEARKHMLEELHPERVLSRGYALLRGTPSVGETIEIVTRTHEISAKIITQKNREKE